MRTGKEGTSKQRPNDRDSNESDDGEEQPEIKTEQDSRAKKKA